MKKREPAGEGRNRRQKIRPLAAFLLAAALVITAFQIPGVAAKAAALDLEKQCSLKVIPSGDSDYFEDLKDNVAIDLYQVAGVEKISGYDSYKYIVGSDFSGLSSYLGESNLSSLTSEIWREISQKAAAAALGTEKTGDELKPVMTVENLDEASDLDAGLYLIVARAKDADSGIYTMKAEKPQEGEPAPVPQIVTEIQTDQYVYTFLPELISLPNRENDAGEANTANPIEWQYDVTAILKPEREYRKKDIEIVKTLADQSLMTEPATFVFRVEAYMDEDNDGTEELVYNNVVGMTFNGESRQSVKLAEQIPVGARVVVTEVYSGASYDVSGTDTWSNDKVAADDVLQATFTNTPTNNHRGGHGIVNSFTYGEGTWTWSADPAQPESGAE